MTDESRQHWENFPGPTYYAPRKVESALASLCEVHDARSANDAYNRVLFAVGNNHRGTVYPAATAAAPRVLEIALSGEGLVRTTALDVVLDLLLFAPEPGFETFERLDCSVADVKESIRASIRQNEEPLFTILADQRESEKDRVIALSILDLSTTEPSRLVSLARHLLSQNPTLPDLLRACSETVEEHAPRQ